MKVKIFFVNDPTSKKGRPATAFESDINAWLAENSEIEIERVEQSSSGGSLGPSLWMVSIWHK